MKLQLGNTIKTTKLVKNKYTVDIAKGSQGKIVYIDKTPPPFHSKQPYLVQFGPYRVWCDDSVIKKDKVKEKI